MLLSWIFFFSLSHYLLGWGLPMHDWSSSGFYYLKTQKDAPDLEHLKQPQKWKQIFSRNCQNSYAQFHWIKTTAAPKQRLTGVRVSACLVASSLFLQELALLHCAYFLRSIAGSYQKILLSLFIIAKLQLFMLYKFFGWSSETCSNEGFKVFALMCVFIIYCIWTWTT